MFTKADMKQWIFKTTLILIFGVSYIFINSIGVNTKKTSFMIVIMVVLTFIAVFCAENQIKSREDIAMLMLKTWVTLTHEWSIATLLSYMTSEQVSMHFIIIATIVVSNGIVAVALAPIAFLALTAIKPQSNC